MECDEGDVVGLDPLVERTIRQHLGVHTILVQLLMNHKQKKKKNAAAAAAAARVKNTNTFTCTRSDLVHNTRAYGIAHTHSLQVLSFDEKSDLPQLFLNLYKKKVYTHVPGVLNDTRYWYM